MRDPDRCAYCKELVLGQLQQRAHNLTCARAPWNIQPGWQAVALVHTPWWRRLLGR